MPPPSDPDATLASLGGRTAGWVQRAPMTVPQSWAERWAKATRVVGRVRVERHAVEAEALVDLERRTA